MGAGSKLRAWTARIRQLKDLARRDVGEHEITCLRADNEARFWSSFRLIYLAYLRSGLARPNRHELRFLPHHLLATTSVLLATCGEPIGTLSLIEYGEFGVPTELLYVDEVAQLRRGGKRVADLACLAAGECNAKLRKSVLRVLLQSALELAVRQEVDFLTVCIHPRHARFYRDRLGFKPLGGTKACPWVCGRPAVGLYRALDDGATAKRPEDSGSFHCLSYTDVASELRSDVARKVFWQYLSEASPIDCPARRVMAA